eukprot:GHVL01015440.1.p1 GENE.GHVL01015440.1~~GHVL01015440.1.p1  ORF type:complete len:359 (+),score=79.06 GHVL01015440.1:27-1103(+)
MRNGCEEEIKQITTTQNERNIKFSLIYLSHHPNSPYACDDSFFLPAGLSLIIDSNIHYFNEHFDSKPVKIPIKSLSNDPLLLDHADQSWFLTQKMHITEDILKLLLPDSYKEFSKYILGNVSSIFLHNSDVTTAKIMRGYATLPSDRENWRVERTVFNKAGFHRRMLTDVSFVNRESNECVVDIIHFFSNGAFVDGDELKSEIKSETFPVNIQNIEQPQWSASSAVAINRFNLTSDMIGKSSNFPFHIRYFSPKNIPINIYKNIMKNIKNIYKDDNKNRNLYICPSIFIIKCEKNLKIPVIQWIRTADQSTDGWLTLEIPVGNCRDVPLILGGLFSVFLAVFVVIFCHNRRLKKVSKE